MSDKDKREDVITLRDYFAGQILKSSMGSMLELRHLINNKSHGYYAQDIYKMADAMIKARDL